MRRQLKASDAAIEADQSVSSPKAGKALQARKNGGERDGSDAGAAGSTSGVSEGETLAPGRITRRTESGARRAADAKAALEVETLRQGNLMRLGCVRAQRLHLRVLCTWLTLFLHTPTTGC
jgi:hypothetical protein